MEPHIFHGSFMNHNYILMQFKKEYISKVNEITVFFNMNSYIICFFLFISNLVYIQVQTSILIEDRNNKNEM